MFAEVLSHNLTVSVLEFNGNDASFEATKINHLGWAVPARGVLVDRGLVTDFLLVDR